MRSAGFTIIEVMMAIFVLTVAVGGSFALIQQTLVSASINQQKLIAYYLAQEGIEIVRNIRDSNWLEKRSVPDIPWDDAISDNLSVGQSQNYLTAYNESELISFEDKVLNLDEDGFYSYSSGTPTRFKREITIAKTDIDSFKVSVKIQWSERGRTHNVEVIDHLYNWKL
jgi:prepilin-type N-terminal cleavage/methylation domain-containing protein